ncbi:MAG: RIP metalloprotease RseP [Parcubacteria group bacterium]
MLAVIVFIIILGVLIFVHELGHFVTARRNGIRASEFGFGFPPRIVGFQFLTGQEEKEELELESMEVETADVKSDDREIITKTVTQKFREVLRNVPVKRWRIIWGAEDGDDEREMMDLDAAHKRKLAGGTIYSLNWIPLGGFVKIKGEDGGNAADTDSFAAKSAWVRTKVLGAGVMMNFVLAWFLLSIIFIIGAPQAVDPNMPRQDISGLKIQISDVALGTPASMAGIKIGDEIIGIKLGTGENIKPQNVKEVQEVVNAHKGEKIIFSIKRGGQALALDIVPRVDAPKDQGALGVSLAETVIVSYPWYQAIWEGLKTTLNLIEMIFMALVGIIYGLLMGHGAGADVSGPIGIAVLTKEVTGLGLVYVLQFTALLSVNLGIINILPIPALDGGRILFILIEKLKGSPVSAKVEQTFHSIGFALLIGLLILVTFRDVLHYVK